MSDITKIKVDGEPESSYQLYPRNEEFAKRSDVQPDWNQNNPAAPDYVKNRTHWTEPEILDVIFQQDDVALYDATDFLQSEQSLVLSEELVVGDTYNVNIDGVDHYVVCYTHNSDVHLGKEWPDRFMLFGSGSSATLYLYNFNYGSTVRLTITHITPSKIHKLDPKYLPDEVIDSIDNAQTTANNAQTTANNAQTTANNAQTTANNAKTTAKNAQTTANSKMNAANPVGTGSFSMGRKANSLVGNKSHAEGNDTIASGQCSHAEGYNTTASGYGSHAEGNNTTASGYDAHAEGFRTTSSGDYSHAEGNNTTASSQYSHVQGKYNVVDSSSKYAHIVGNGEDVSTRSNAHTLDWNGVPWFQGRPQFGGSAQDEGSQTVMANGDKEIILTSSTADSTKKFKITVDDSGALTATEITQ